MELSYHYWNPKGNQNEKTNQNRLVLLHGMGGTGALWRPIAAGLEDEFAILAPDQRGHGKSRLPHLPGSRKTVGYTPRDYGQDVVDTMNSLEFHPAWILGHSMGVRTAVAAAHLRPEWVKGLVLVDLGFSGFAGGGLGQGLGNFIKLLPHDFATRVEAREFMKEKCPDPSIAQYLLAVSVTDPDGRLSFPFDHSALIQTIEAARDFSVRAWVRELAQKGMPILVLRGEKSLVWNSEEFQEEVRSFSDLPPVVFQEIPNAGHGLPFEQRPTFVKVLREFLETH